MFPRRDRLQIGRIRILRPPAAARLRNSVQAEDPIAAEDPREPNASPYAA